MYLLTELKRFSDEYTNYFIHGVFAHKPHLIKQNKKNVMAKFRRWSCVL